MRPRPVIWFATTRSSFDMLTDNMTKYLTQCRETGSGKVLEFSFASKWKQGKNRVSKINFTISFILLSQVFCAHRGIRGNGHYYIIVRSFIDSISPTLYCNSSQYPRKVITPSLHVFSNEKQPTPEAQTTLKHFFLLYCLLLNWDQVFYLHYTSTF